MHRTDERGNRIEARHGSHLSDLFDSPEQDDRTQGVILLDRLGGAGTADRLRRELRRSGVTSLPKQPNEATRVNPGGLTNRQLEVDRLLARGHDER